MPLSPQKEIAKQNILCLTPPQPQPGVIVQNAKQFSVSAKQMTGHGHDHTKLWTAEKALSVGLLGIVPAAFLIPSQFMDYLLAITVVMHNHW
jgi:succinate dehydrogenase (ubiquinone) membrane anchor subunit